MQETYTDIVLAIHGGAGVLRKEVISETDAEEYLKHLTAALQSGYSVLRGEGRIGGSALDAVEAAVSYLEDCPLFNAGRGCVLNEEGEPELDAAIMDGATKSAGAVACVKTVRNPITAARAVMEQSQHVLLAGTGADEFAKECDLQIVSPEYFRTERQTKALERSKKEEASRNGISPNRMPALSKHGTVGAVAVDAGRNLAAATSTGGTINKLNGRIGDSPLIGAGTYAENATCAVSATGHGEYFMRWVAAYEVSALMKYAGLDLHHAANRVINETLKSVGGEGGLIALDAQGNCALPFNTEGMFRGCITRDGRAHVAIFG